MKISRWFKVLLLLFQRKLKQLFLVLILSNKLLSQTFLWFKNTEFLLQSNHPVPPCRISLHEKDLGLVYGFNQEGLLIYLMKCLFDNFLNTVGA